MRPPTTSHTADVSGPPLSPTVIRRPVVLPTRVPGPCDGVAPDDPYVRTYWVAAVGPAAVVDLLRLAAAARAARAIPAPVNLPMLLSEGLVSWREGELAVLDPLPRVSAAHLKRRGVRLTVG
ncbi:MAG: hypothetical protein ACFCVC_07850 [Acidimicrobiia bacterium]